MMAPSRTPAYPRLMAGLVISLLLTAGSASARPSLSQLRDNDHDGYNELQGDCNDYVPSIHPGAPEICGDGVDQDCDGVDAGCCDSDKDGDGACSDADCDDADPSVFPGADETCDGKDNDCDGTIDEGVTTTYYLDADGDGFGSLSSTEACSRPDGYAVAAGDCNDKDATIYPSAPEICDGLDNDCDTLIDEDAGTVVQYVDADGDGYGTGPLVTACDLEPGYAPVAGDCDDGDGSVYPGAAEVCNGTDDDCDGTVDEGVVETFYQDEDGDGYGNAAVASEGCTAPAGFVANSTDCDDNDATVFPGASEQCDGVDNDCDGLVDEGVGEQTWYLDADGDGYGVDGSTTVSCTAPDGYVSAGGDCDDTDATVNPGASEQCDGIDNDCDGAIDDGVVTATYYQDADGDGYGDTSVSEVACVTPDGYVATPGDCDDANSAINPGVLEVCDGVDNNCDGAVDEGYDADGDGYAACDIGSTPRDCDDADPAVYPGADEVCDAQDNDCNGVVDDGLTQTYYPDQDLDGYGDETSPVESCTAPDGYTTVGGDCDDAMWSVNPDGVELCNGFDDDCDGLVDAVDVFDVTTGALGDVNSACDTYDKVAGVEIPLLRITYDFAGQTGSMTFYDTLLIAGHTPGVNPPRGWPSGCTYLDDGVYWYSQSSPDYVYLAAMAVSEGTDATGGDEVYLQVSYMGITAGGAFNNEEDGDGMDEVYLSPEESTDTLQVWYVTDSATTSGIGYSATMEVHDARLIVNLNP